MLQAIIALGNPGPEYAKTRHNAGWLLVDAFAEKQGLKWKNEEKFQARVTKAEVEGRGVWLVKPQTFMNLSGNRRRHFSSSINLNWRKCFWSTTRLPLTAGASDYAWVAAPAATTESLTLSKGLGRKRFGV